MTRPGAQRHPRPPFARRAATVAAVAAAVVLAAGCVERRIRVTSDPPGARVWLNDTEIGRTPVETEFLWHGVYDVRLELDGYEPVHEGRRAKAPVWEYPVVDLLATAAPIPFEKTHAFHFDLIAEPEAARLAAADAADPADRPPLAEDPEAAASEAELLRRALAVEALVEGPPPTP